MATEASKPKRKAGKPRARLTAQQEAFAQHYGLHGRASDAYRHAYPKSKAKPQVIAVEANKLLANPKIALRVQQLQQRVQAIADKRFNVTAERVLAGLAAIAFADPTAYFVWSTERRPIYRGGQVVRDAAGNPVTKLVPVAILKPSSCLTPEERAAVCGLEMSTGRDGAPTVNVKLGDKRAALRDLGTYLGLFDQRVEQLHKHQHVHAHLEVPNLEQLDPAAALKSFESFRLKLAQQPALPPPQPSAVIDAQAEAVPAAA